MKWYNAVIGAVFVIVMVIWAGTISGCGSATIASTSEQPKTDKTQTAQAWVKVASLAGDGNKRGATFKLQGNDQKLVYSVKGGSMSMAAIYVLAKGESLEADGGFPEVMPDKAGTGKTRLVKDAGSYYIDVAAANCDWTVAVWEKR